MDEQARKTALRMISTGLYVLTCRLNDEVSGSTVSWVAQASFQPPLVMMGIRQDSHSHELLKKNAAIALHFLNKQQKDVAERFFKPAKIENGRLNGMAFEIKPSGALVLTETPAHVEVKVAGRLELGDHTVFVVEVTDAQVRDKAPALAMSDTPWHYGG